MEILINFWAQKKEQGSMSHFEVTFTLVRPFTLRIVHFRPFRPSILNLTHINISFLLLLWKNIPVKNREMYWNTTNYENTCKPGDYFAFKWFLIWVRVRSSVIYQLSKIKYRAHKSVSVIKWIKILSIYNAPVYVRGLIWPKLAHPTKYAISKILGIRPKYWQFKNLTIQRFEI